METTTCDIYAVYERETRAGTKFDVFPRVPTDSLMAPVFSTFDAHAAAQCRRAQEQRRPVTLTWQETRYGREIVTVQA